VVRKILNMTNIAVRKLAQLSKVKVGDEEESDLLKKLEETIKYIDNLNEIDTNSLVSTSSPIGLTNVYFDDMHSCDRSLLPKRFVVRNVLDKSDNE
jgi:aspartyl/glutamyl-tRNA(Asn/Gln) amidotransferase C subunit